MMIAQIDLIQGYAKFNNTRTMDLRYYVFFILYVLQV